MKRTLPVACACALSIAATLNLAQADDAALPALLNSITETVRLLQERHIAIDAPAARRAAIAAVAQSADPLARVVSGDEARHQREELSGADYTAGLRLTMTNGTPKVVEVMPQSPAAEAGLRAGDLLLKIGDAPQQRTDIVSAIRLTRSHGPEPLHITYSRGGTETGSITIVSQVGRVPAVETEEEWPSRLSYIKVNGLYPGTGGDIASAIRKWAEQGRYGVILDLRGAGGADLESAIEISELLAQDGELLFSFRDPADNELRAEKAQGAKPIGMPFMVLIDGHTSGASELLAAVLNGSVRGAMLLGQPTRGDPLIREFLALPSGDELYVATRRLVTADGTVFAGTNRVAPDILVSAAGDERDYEPDAAAERRVTLDEEIADKALRERLRGDRTLRRATDILLGLKALNIRGYGLTSK